MLSCDLELFACHRGGRYILFEDLLLIILDFIQESADNVSPDSSSPSKDALLEEACRKYDEATRLSPTLHDVGMLTLFHIFICLKHSFMTSYTIQL